MPGQSAGYAGTSSCSTHVLQVEYTHMTDPIRLSDGSLPLLGLRVFRVYPEDGTPKAGKPRGPRLRIVAIRDLQEGATVRPGALAVLKRYGGKAEPAGTEPVWNLKRAPGWQPHVRRDSQTAARRSAKRRGTPVSSIRLTDDMRERLLLRGNELGWVVRRDVDRLYDLIDAARALMIFPAGTLETLAKAWSLAAPPPPQNQLRPQWFVPIILDACRRLGTESAMKLAAYAETWTPIESLAVQDAVERWEPEASHADKLRTAGLQDEPPPDASVDEIEARRSHHGRKVKA